MIYDHPHCLISYNLYRNKPICPNTIDAIICFECLYHDILHKHKLRGRSAFYAGENITLNKKCYKCKKVKKLLYENIPVSKFYQEKFDISEPEYTQVHLFDQWRDDNERVYKHCCLQCYEKTPISLFYRDLADIKPYCADCEICDSKNTGCIRVVI